MNCIKIAEFLILIESIGIKMIYYKITIFSVKKLIWSLDFDRESFLVLVGCKPCPLAAHLGTNTYHTFCWEGGGGWVGVYVFRFIHDALGIKVVNSTSQGIFFTLVDTSPHFIYLHW